MDADLVVPVDRNLATPLRNLVGVGKQEKDLHRATGVSAFTISKMSRGCQGSLPAVRLRGLSLTVSGLAFFELELMDFGDVPAGGLRGLSLPALGASPLSCHCVGPL